MRTLLAAARPRRSAALLAAPALGAALLLAGTAAAQPGCARRADLVAHLSTQYREEPVGFGIAGNGALVEVFIGVGGETWTIVATFANGLSCIVIDGQQWQVAPAAPAPSAPNERPS